MGVLPHRCSKCGHEFDPTKGRINNLSWSSVFTRPVRALPLGEDIETFSLVKCPHCGQSEDATELRLFGVIPGKHVKLLLGLLLLVILAFGYWIIVIA